MAATMCTSQPNAPMLDSFLLFFFAVEYFIITHLNVISLRLVLCMLFHFLCGCQFAQRFYVRFWVYFCVPISQAFQPEGQVCRFYADDETWEFDHKNSFTI